MSHAASPTAAFHDVRIDMKTSHHNIPTPPPVVTTFAPDQRSREDLKASSYYTCNAFLPATAACESSSCLQSTSRVLPTAKPLQTQCEASSRLFAQPSASITHTSLPHSQLNSNSNNYYCANTIDSSSSSVGHAMLQSNGQTCLVSPQRCTLTTTTVMNSTASLRNNNITTATLPHRLPAQQLPLQAQHTPTHTPRVMVVKALQPQYGPPSAPASTPFVPAVSFSSTRQGPLRVELRVLRQTNTETKTEETADVSTTNQEEEEDTDRNTEEVVNEAPLPQSRAETDCSPFAVNGLQVLHFPHYITVPPRRMSHMEGSSAAQASTQSLDSHSFPATTTGTAAAAANIISDVSSFSLSHDSMANRVATTHASHCGASSASPLSRELTGPTCTDNALAWPYTGTQTHTTASQEGALDKFLDVITTRTPSMCGLSWSNGTDESQLIELSMQSVVIPEVAQRFVRDGARRQHYAQHSTGGYVAH